MARRVRIKVRWNRGLGMWLVVEAGANGTGSTRHATKRSAVDEGRRLARSLYKQGTNAQVVILNKNGRIQEERTYGADPRRFKG